MSRLPLILCCVLSIAGCATAPNDPPRSASLETGPAPRGAACPSGVPPSARCLNGTDTAGAHYWIALPQSWNGVLVLHAHGGPELGEPKAERNAEDLARWAIMVKAGYAWAGSTYRQGGVAVRSAAEDTERLRQIFVAQAATPKRTILHGQSWGASVAATAAEMFATAQAGRSPYDAVLLTSGVLGGGTRSYDFRLDLRVIYQAVCGNHPLPNEPQYPLWQGLPPASTLTRAELARRVDECTGVRHAAAERSESQKRNLQTLLNTARIPERSLIAHLNWGTWHFQDIVFRRLDGRNPFGNIGAQYAGSSDDAALNKKVARYAADPQAVARFAADADPRGHIAVPVLSVHAIHDPTAFVELETSFRDTMDKAGTADHLVQTFTDESDHSYLSDAEYPALLSQLLAWADGGPKPTSQSVADTCKAMEPRFGGGCHFVVDFRPEPLDTRTTPRRH